MNLFLQPTKHSTFISGTTMAAVRRRRPNVWSLHHDNALSCTSHSAKRYLIIRNMLVLELSQYSSDLAQCVFLKFSRVKVCWSGIIINQFKTFHGNVTTVLKGLNENGFQSCYRVRQYEGVSRSFRTESITKYTPTFRITHLEATKRVMAAKLIRLAHKIAIKPHLVTEICTTCSSRSRRTVRELLNSPSCMLECLYEVRKLVR
jgi:hypothetical protein